MLTLMLLRHAKAEQHGRGNDAARKLTSKGEAGAAALGAHMAELGILPDFALVSAAARTRGTLEFFVQGAGVAIPARFEESLYNASDLQLRDTLRIVDAKVATLIIIGHNPGIMDLASLLARHGDAADLGRLNERFPPCALAVIAFDVETWSDARTSGGRLDLLLMPEDIVRTG